MPSKLKETFMTAEDGRDVNFKSRMLGGRLPVGLET